MRRQLPPQAGFEEGISYRIVPCAPPPPADEIDGNERAVEVTIVWGMHSVLAVEHVPAGRGFSVGDACDAHGVLGTDYLIGADALGASRVPIVVDDGSGPRVWIKGTLEPLQRDQTLHVSHGAFHFIVREVAAAKRIGTDAPLELDVKQQRWTLASFAAHALLIALFYFAPPPSQARSVDMLRIDPRYGRYLDIAITPPEPDILAPARDSSVAEGGEAHAGDAGKAGKQKAPKVPRRMAVEGPLDNAAPAIPREQQVEQLAETSIIGVLTKAGAESPVSSIFGTANALGNDPASAMGVLLGALPGESQGQGGLAMIGTGAGGGRFGDTVGVGSIGTRGIGGGSGGYGSSAGALRGRSGTTPRIISHPPQIIGSLSKEVIRRVINRRINEVRYCYTQSLNARPELQGRVVVQFMIAPSGVVQAAAVVPGATDLGHGATEQCIRGVVSRMTFPAPEAGIVSVTYPFVLQQVGN